MIGGHVGSLVGGHLGPPYSVGRVMRYRLVAHGRIEHAAQDRVRGADRGLSQPAVFSSTFHASMWDGLSLSSGLAPILLPTMCVRAIVLYRFFVVAFRPDASSAALLDRFVPKYGR
jgi:hypothetical protein